MTQPTNEQIKHAQEAGNSAYESAKQAGLSDEQCAREYSIFYNGIMEYFAAQQAAPLTAADIADMDSRCNEQASDEYSSATEGHW